MQNRIVLVGSLLLLGSTLVPPDASLAQTTVGFSNPSDMEALLSYRLPDWGYRTILADLFLNGNGSNNSGCSPCQDNNAANIREQLTLNWYRESESRQWTLSAHQNGDWRWRELDSNSQTSTGSNLQGRLDAGITGRRYLAGDVSVSGGASASGIYEEARQRTGSFRDLRVQRTFLGELKLGFGFGRFRDVTPVLRAKRLSERLQALGREPLTTEEVLRLASEFARVGGYFSVYDRPDRHFWSEVLEPIVARGGELTPYETLYLRETVFELQGSRQEGFVVDLRGRVSRETVNGDPGLGRTEWGPDLEFRWSHNLSLDHQLSADAGARYTWGDYGGDTDREEGLSSISLGHLWVLADRVHWSTGLSGQMEYSDVSPGGATEHSIARRQFAVLSTAMSFFVEDRVSLGPRITASLDRRKFEDQDWLERVSWSLTLNATYDLEKLLF